MIGRAFWFDAAELVAEMMCHPGTQGTLEKRLLGLPHDRPDRLGGHGTGAKLVEHSLEMGGNDGSTAPVSFFLRGGIHGPFFTDGILRLTHKIPDTLGGNDNDALDYSRVCTPQTKMATRRHASRHLQAGKRRRPAPGTYSTALTISSMTFFASPNTIMVLSM